MSESNTLKSFASRNGAVRVKEENDSQVTPFADIFIGRHLLDKMGSIERLMEGWKDYRAQNCIRYPIANSPPMESCLPAFLTIFCPYLRAP